jgi:hypothetical protein
MSRHFGEKPAISGLGLAPVVLIGIAMASAAELDEPSDGHSRGESIVWATQAFDALQDAPVSTVSCGVDCTFVLARLLGNDATLRDVEGAVRVGERGSSLVDLREGAQSLGLSMASVRCAPDDLDRLPLPAIALQEPSDNDASNHYIVVLRVDADRVTFADPAVHRISEVTRSSFVRATTGAYLVPVPTAGGRWLGAIWFAVGAATLGAWIYFRAVRGRARGPLGLTANACLLVLAAAVTTSAPGCGEINEGSPLDPASSADFAPVADGPSVLAVDATRIDLGNLEPDASAAATFYLRNKGPQAVNLETGPPSYRCLAATLKPPGPLPAGGTAGLTLELNTANQAWGGRISAQVTVGVVRSTEAYMFEVTGVLEGLAPGPEYVVRARHLETGELPDLRFSILTRQDDAKVAVLSVAIAAHFTDDEALAALTAGGTPAGPALEPQLAGLVADAVRLVPGQECYSHDFAVPIAAPGLNRPALGDFVIEYRIGDRAQQAKVPLLVVAPRGRAATDGSP